MARLLLLLAALAAFSAASCSDRSKSAEAREEDANMRPRRFHPPPAQVRAVPPHNIHDGGMGPYVLDMPLKEVLDLLPHGPRVELCAVEDLFNFNLVRAENESLLIGASRGGGVAFVGALDAEVARTEAGIGAGTQGEDLDRALGTLELRDDVARDPRIREYVALPNVRFVMDGDKAEAVMVGQAVERGSGKANAASPRDAGVRQGRSTCGAVSALSPSRHEIIEAGGVGRIGVELAYGCFEAGEGAVVSNRGKVALVVGEPGAFRRVATTTVDGLVFAKPIDLDGDRAQEIAAVSRRVSPVSQVLRVELFRPEASRLEEVAGEDVYRLSASAAALVGARLSDVEFLAEIHAYPEAVHVGGLFLQRAGASIHNLVPLETETIAVRRKRTPAPIDAGGADGAPGPAAAKDAGAGAGAP